MLEAGTVRGKNSIDNMLKNMLDFCWTAIGFWLVGYAFAYGDTPGYENPFIGTGNFLTMNFENYGYWIFQLSFASASSTIVGGAVAGTSALWWHSTVVNVIAV
jgi:Amt family ammonium transporter